MFSFLNRRVRARFVFAGLLMIGFVVGCAPKPVLVITVGGLGFSQMGNLRHAIDKRCNNADVQSAGAWDAYKTDLVAMVKKSPHKHVVLIGHSLGCGAIDQAAEKLPKVDLLVFLEPAWDEIRVPRQVQKVLWYRRTNFDFIRPGTIRGFKPIDIQGGHNDVPNATPVIEQVVKTINEIRDPK